MATEFNRPATLTFGSSIKLHLIIGLALTALFWPASWLHWGVLGEYAFFPLWLGYILTVDGIVAARRGSSLLTRAPKHLVGLFLLSAPIWWLFESTNNFTLNWHYAGAEQYSIWHIILEATADFSTVIPAVFETTALVLTFDFVSRFQFPRFHFSFSRGALWLLMYVGAFSFLALILIPEFSFPLTWLWLFLLVDPLNWMRNRPSLLKQFAQGDWGLGAALAVATLICGFFWEMWNFYSWPKWYYTVPYVGFFKIFEMPLLGYLGYIPFAWELFALYHFVLGVLKVRPLNVQTFQPET